MGVQGPAPSSVPRYAKLDFQKFDGSLDPLIWLHNCDQFFWHQQTQPEDRVPLAAYHMFDEALLWYHQFRYENPLYDWEIFRASCMLRFGPPARHYPLGDLVNLKQSGSLAQYQKSFQEKLARATDLVHPNLYVPLFTAGLVEALRIEVALLAPTTLDHAMNLARSLDAKNRILRDSLGRRPPWSGRPTPAPPPAPPNFLHPNPNTTPPLQPPTTTLPPQFIKCLSKVDQEQRCAQGLGFNCDEKYHPGHQCQRLFYLEGGDPEEGDLSDTEDEPAVEEPDISLHAMTDLHNTNTMQVHAVIHNLMLVALVDSGSTHNFLSQTAAQQLGLPVQHNSGLSVLVDNGTKLSSLGVCSAVRFDIEGHPFEPDFLVIPLAGFDLVLGIKWLQQLGPILWDFTSLTMTFTSDQQDLTLHGTHAPARCTLQNLQVTTSDSSNLQSLISEFGDLFREPQSPPPIRTCDHLLQLKLGTKPVIVRPYRYPHIQKDEIEKQCQQILEQDLIQSKRSSFASSVLLVRKKDQTWLFYVDYRELNSHTVKEKFPIPVVDEFLDELHGANFFTKLDLRSGYHQI
ncbi:uncharacterized protein [Aristolochia californica]|uniref:uncharacterized protein n=1 Tax=Aristolochia californica TaxID=171875 RepID=UPI0035D6B011